MTKPNNLRGVIARHERAQAVLLAAVIAAGGRWATKTTLWKAFWWAHVESMRTLGAELTDHQIVRLPHGPAPDNGDDLLEGLVRSGQLKQRTEKRDHHRVTLFDVPDLAGAKKWVATRLRRASVGVVAEAAKKFASMTADEASQFSHKFSHEWRHRGNGQPMDIYCDLLSESDLANAIIDSREDSEALAGVFGPKSGR